MQAPTSIFQLEMLEMRFSNLKPYKKEIPIDPWKWKPYVQKCEVFSTTKKFAEVTS